MRTNLICLLLAVAGLSFGVGQMTASNAEPAQSSRVVVVKDKLSEKWLRFIWGYAALPVSVDVERGFEKTAAQLHVICLALRQPNSGPLCP